MNDVRPESADTPPPSTMGADPGPRYVPSERIVVTSGDGVELLVEARGTGDPIVFVHGTLGDRTDWAPVAAQLSARCRTYVFDRRGRGGSGDDTDYSIDREVDDLLAVADACDAPVHVVGHSFGAIVALLAASRAGSGVASLVVYEPPVDGRAGDEDPGRSAAFADRLERLVRAGEPDAAVTAFVLAANGSIDHLDDLPASVRTALRDAVRSASREIRAAAEVLPFTTNVLDEISARCLVLLGDEQHLATYSGVRGLADRLPNAAIATVPGGHLANLTHPGVVAATISTFVDPS